MTLEQLGIPSVLVVTRFFEALTTITAARNGFPSMKRHVLPHPLNSLPDEAIRKIADEHADAVFGKLVEGGAP